MTGKNRKRIILYGFVLTVFVIWLHAGEPLITSIPGQIAVPGFFILSGFLFFLGIPTEEERTGGLLPGWLKAFFPEGLLRKIGRRVRTLLVPYLLWNTACFLLYLLFGKASWEEAAASVFHYRCNPVFWYLWQLILITLLTPVQYVFLRKKGTGLLWLFLTFALAVFYLPLRNLLGFHLVNGDALFYYSLGGFASLHIYRKEPENTTGEKWRNLLVSLVLLLLFSLLEGALPASLINAGTVGAAAAGAVSLWFILCLIPEVKVYPWMKITFFVYATHYLLIRLVWAAQTAAGLNESAAANMTTYLLMPVICVGIGYGIFVILKKWLPGLLNLLTGGRGD